MLEAKSLTILPIDDLDVYYCHRMRGYTTLSLHVDGSTVYSLDIRGIVKALSGKDTVGAFKSAQKSTLVAWIDPVSGEFISSDSTASDALFSIPIFGAVGLFLGGLLHSNVWVVAPFVALLAAAAYRRFLRAEKNNAELEALLRKRRTDVQG